MRVRRHIVTVLTARSRQGLFAGVPSKLAVWQGRLQGSAYIPGGNQYIFKSEYVCNEPRGHSWRGSQAGYQHIAVHTELMQIGLTCVDR